MKVLTIGSFDLLHEGHIKLFERCARLGELWVGLNSDEFVLHYKKKKPSIPYDTRAAVIKALRSVHRVEMNYGQGAALIRRVDPDILAVGSDWMLKDYLAQIDMTEYELEKRNILLIYLPYTKNISTTKLKENL